jgi:hypothetical protein
MMFSGWDFVVFGLICALIGWGAIEFIGWVLSHNEERL